MARITGPGYYMPFHEVFADDLPNPEDRDRLLKMIALTPRLTPGGFVDTVLLPGRYIDLAGYFLQCLVSAIRNCPEVFCSPKICAQTVERVFVSPNVPDVPKTNNEQVFRDYEAFIAKL